MLQMTKKKGFMVSQKILVIFLILVVVSIFSSLLVKGVSLVGLAQKCNITVQFILLKLNNF